MEELLTDEFSAEVIVLRFNISKSLHFSEEISAI